jgi:hypothetical protein
VPDVSSNAPAVVRMRAALDVHIGGSVRHRGAGVDSARPGRAREDLAKRLLALHCPEALKII